MVRDKNKAAPKTVPSGPLFQRFDQDKANRAKLRADGYTDARITNWKRRGIPRGEVPDIAKRMGLTFDQYFELATGKKYVVQEPSAAYITPEEEELLDSYRNAPADWKAALRRLARADRGKQVVILRQIEGAPATATLERGQREQRKSKRLGEKIRQRS